MEPQTKKRYWLRGAIIGAILGAVIVIVKVILYSVCVSSAGNDLCLLLFALPYGFILRSISLFGYIHSMLERVILISIFDIVLTSLALLVLGSFYSAIKNHIKQTN